MSYIYANLADVKLYCDTRTLVQLTVNDDTVDLTDASNIDEDVLMAAENDAAATINNYIRHVYNTPLTGTALTQEIIAICAKLTWCILWERRDYEPPNVTALRDRLYDRLKRMQAGLDEVRDGRVVAKRKSER